MCCSLHQNTDKERELLFACMTGDLDTVRASQLDLRDVRDYSYYSPLHYEYSPLHWAVRLV